MMQLWFAHSFKLLGAFIESSIINCSGMRPREGEIPEIYALQMPQLSVLRE